MSTSVKKPPHKAKKTNKTSKSKAAAPIYLVETILDKRMSTHASLGAFVEYRVKWQGFPEDEV